MMAKMLKVGIISAAIALFASRVVSFVVTTCLRYYFGFI